MKNRWLAASILGGLVLATAVVLVADISPHTARVDRPTTFTYSGDGEVLEWCAREPGSPARTWDFCRETSSTSFSYTFSSSGDGAVKVTVDYGRGAQDEDQAVEVRP